MCCWCGNMKKNKNKKAESLTIKALDPFSPFISLASNIKHATEESKYWVRLRHNNPAAALFNQRLHISSGTTIIAKVFLS